LFCGIAGQKQKTFNMYNYTAKNKNPQYKKTVKGCAGKLNKSLITLTAKVLIGRRLKAGAPAAITTTAKKLRQNKTRILINKNILFNSYVTHGANAGTHKIKS
jgi:hypothetical protein